MGVNKENTVVANNDMGPLVSAKNEHFINPPMFTFCSDSLSVIQKLPRNLSLLVSVLFHMQYTIYA